MPNANIKYRLIKPEETLADFVYCFSALQDVSHIEEGIIIPNGKVDLIFTVTDNGQLRTALLGLETKPKITNVKVSAFLAVNFNPLAVEYVLQDSIADIRNAEGLPTIFWDFTVNDLHDFDAFCEKAYAQNPICVT
jgi:hypothetical protein